MFNLHLTAEQIEFRGTLRRFAANEIRPAAIHPDRLEPFAKPLLKELLDQASGLGLRTLTLSEEAGGVGGDTLTACIVFEELAAGDVDIAITIGQTALLGGLLFDKWMSADQRQNFLPQFIKDTDFHLAYAGPDPGALTGWSYHQDLPGDDDGGLSAAEQGGEWVIDGSVAQVANAPLAGLFIVPVRTDSGKSGALLVPRGAPGLTVEQPVLADSESQARWHLGCAAGIAFDACKVAAENILGLDGGDYAMQGAILRAAVNLGVGQAAFDAAVDYAQIRRQGGREIAQHQAIGKFIADMAVKLELARTMIWKAAWAADHPEAINDGSVTDLPLHTVAGVFTAEAVNQVTLLAAECFGAMAVMRDMPLQKYVEDGYMFLNSDLNDSATRLRIAEAVVAFRRSLAA